MKKWQLYKTQKQPGISLKPEGNISISSDAQARGYLYKDLLRTLVVTIFVLSILAILMKTQNSWENLIKLP